MFERIKAWLRPQPQVVEEAPVDPIDELTDQEFLNKMFLDTPVKMHGGPLLSGMARDYGETQHACNMRNCVRPSAFTVMTSLKLDVDIPFSTPDTIRRRKTVVDWNTPPDTPFDPPAVSKQPELPIFKLFMLCDRCYKRHVRGSDQVAYVIGPAHIYNPDEHKETQAKLAPQA